MRRAVIPLVLLLSGCTGTYSATQCTPAPGGGEACTVFHQVTGKDAADPTLAAATAYHNGAPVGFSMTAIKAPIVDLASSAIGGALQGAGFYAGATSVAIPKEVSTTVKLTQ